MVTLDFNNDRTMLVPNSHALWPCRHRYAIATSSSPPRDGRGSRVGWAETSNFRAPAKGAASLTRRSRMRLGTAEHRTILMPLHQDSRTKQWPGHVVLGPVRCAHPHSFGRSAGGFTGRPLGLTRSATPS